MSQGDLGLYIALQRFYVKRARDVSFQGLQQRRLGFVIETQFKIRLALQEVGLSDLLSRLLGGRAKIVAEPAYRIFMLTGERITQGGAKCHLHRRFGGHFAPIDLLV